jgi:hypothetical protein
LALDPRFPTTNTTSTDDDSTANHTNTNDECSDAAKGNNANGADNSHSIGGGDCEKNNPSSDDGDNTSSEVNGSWKALRFTMSRQVLLLNRIVRIPTLRARKPMKNRWSAAARLPLSVLPQSTGNTRYR